MSKAIISTAEAAIAAEHFVKEILLSELMIFASQAQEELDRVVNFLLTGYNRNMQTTQAALQAVSFVEKTLLCQPVAKDTLMSAQVSEYRRLISFKTVASYVCVCKTRQQMLIKGH